MTTAAITHPRFSNIIRDMADTPLHACVQCQTCSSGCPFAEYMDVMPSHIIRMLQLDMKEDVLESSSPWICVGCNTCASECPNAIDIPAVMDAIRETIILEKRTPAEPEILKFHETVLGSIGRFGRTHKLDIMLRYKVASRDLFSDMDTGVKMFSKRKLNVLPHRVKQRRDIKQLISDAREAS